MTKATQSAKSIGLAEIRTALGDTQTWRGSAALFSFFVNLLMLTGPLFMLQIYDRVLNSRSEETLVALFLLVAFLYILMALIDYSRGRVMARIGTKMSRALEARVFTSWLHKAGAPAAQHSAILRDLDVLQKSYSTPIFLTFMDIPWTPIFLAAIFMFHPYLGWLALSGGGVLLTLAALNQIATMRQNTDAGEYSARANRVAQSVLHGSDIIRSQGMQAAMGERWGGLHRRAQHHLAQAEDRTAAFLAAIRAGRLFLQSAILALGAWLVLGAELSAGAMIASSILLGRALAPVERIIAQWPAIVAARAARANLANALGASPIERVRTKLGVPEPSLNVHSLNVVAPRSRVRTLRNISFDLDAGDALAVIGPSGAGKTTLAKTLIGLYPATTGTIRLGACGLDQFDRHDLAGHIGYLPQMIALFDGTIGENIARLSTNPDPAKVIQAAKNANTHQMITALADGYDTWIDGANCTLSGGQKQRIALARAFFGDPVLLILDEPNAALDNEGTAALTASLRDFRALGKTVILMTHQPAAISHCDKLLVLKDGMMTTFGGRDDVLRAMARPMRDTPHAVPNLARVSASDCEPVSVPPTVSKSAPPSVPRTTAKLVARTGRA